MTTENINQIVETIKTLNLNIDSQTAIQIVEEIKPLLWFWIAKDIMSEITLAIFCFFMVFLAYRGLKYAIKDEQKKPD